MVAILAASFLLSACASIEEPKVEPFLGNNPPPVQQELRWSNGKIPQNFDPAKAAAPPETDVVRAMFDGLTDLDSRSLRVIAAIAESWESSDGDKVWTFKLRDDARWSNGDRVTAEDFVRSWKRLRGSGVTPSKTTLTSNIVGLNTSEIDADVPDFIGDSIDRDLAAGLMNSSRLQQSNTSVQTAEPTASPTPIAKRNDDAKFGVVAVNASTLRVSLELPDKDFPSLVADPIFRPVHESFDTDGDASSTKAITSGPFKPSTINGDTLVIERSATYWNSQSIALERIHFIQKPNSEEALKAYRNGDIDVITNAAFEPGALKLLVPFEDFKRSAHAALNFYELNVNDAPLTDRRVREALAITIDREKLTDGDLQGTTKAATGFLPWRNETAEELAYDPQRGRELLARAGFPDGDNFPNLRLAVNRNDTQQRVARVIRKMWQDNLNITVEVDVKSADELNEMRDKKEFDLIRRGTVFAVPNEVVNLTAVFDSPIKKPLPTREIEKNDLPVIAKPAASPVSILQSMTTNDKDVVGDILMDEKTLDLLSEDEALFEMTAIPLYFPISYALVKPYVRGFELNSIDAASLKEISIDTTWQLPKK